MDKIYLIEDHHQALKIWRQKQIQGLDLVHIDAHMDFGFHQARTIGEVVREARSLKELKKGLERSIAFKYYEDDFDKQTNIGNYIYPAVQEGLVKNFYWVIPGGLSEFNESWRFIKSIIKVLSRSRDEEIVIKKRDGIVSFVFLGREFIICVLEKLPILRHKILLDIDADFLVVKSLLKAGNTVDIGKRKPWIMPRDLIAILKHKVRQPQVITIAYSVNGGYMPIGYKILGDELAYYLSPEHFRRSYKQNLDASLSFRSFKLSGKKEDYWNAVKLNPSYRSADNNYGPLCLVAGKINRAEDEFKRIVKVDKTNPYALSGLGEIYLRRKEPRRAKFIFSFALKYKKDLASAVFGLARAEFNLGNFKKAKVLFQQSKKFKPLDAQAYGFLGRIYDKENRFEDAANHYQDAIRLGSSNIDNISRLLKIFCHLKHKDGIINLIRTCLMNLKNEFPEAKKDVLMSGKTVKSYLAIKKKMLILEKRLNSVKKEKRGFFLNLYKRSKK